MNEKIKERVAEVLEQTADAFETGQLQWIQGTGRRRDEEIYGVESACMMRAVALHIPKATVDGESKMYSNVYAALGSTTNSSPIIWNDTPGRTLGEVIDLLKGTAKDLRNSADGS